MYTDTPAEVADFETRGSKSYILLLIPRSVAYKIEPQTHPLPLQFMKLRSYPLSP